MADLTLHHRCDTGDGWIGAASGLQQLHRGLQRGQRITQLVTECGKKLVFPPIRFAQRRLVGGSLGQMVSNLILTFTGAQGAQDRGHERGDPNRPLQQRHVAEHPHGVA